MIGRSAAMVVCAASRLVGIEQGTARSTPITPVPGVMKPRIQPESLVPAMDLHGQLPLHRFFCLGTFVHESGTAN
jgi:hypothetical protein